MASKPTIAARIMEMLKEGAPPAGAPGTGPDWLETWGRTGAHVVKHASAPLRRAVEAKERASKARERLTDKVIWASELGKQCDRQFWYKLHRPELAEPLSGAASFKFTFGHIIEELALTYARTAGMEVSHEQTLVEKVLPNGWTVRGRIDALIEGRIVDVKSCSSYSFGEYQRAPHVSGDMDTFGYVDQLHFYDTNWRPGLPVVPAEFLFIDKQTGNMCSRGYATPLLTGETVKSSMSWAQAIENPAAPPARGYSDKPMSLSSPNRKLGMTCSYCDFKKTCWPGLRAFKYSTGPVFLTEIKDLPRVPEIPLTVGKLEDNG